MYAYGSCVDKNSSLPRIEFETPRTTFFLKAKLSQVTIRSRSTIGEIRSKGIDLRISCGALCTSASFVATLVPGCKVLGTVTRLAPPNRPAPFLPMPTQPTLSLVYGETQIVAANATFVR